jgi:protein SCO1/2
MQATRQLIPVAILLLAFGGGAILLFLAVTAGEPAPVRASILPEPRALPAFSLTNQQGRPFTREGLSGEWRLIFFGFTHCPDICPATLQQLAIARKQAVGNGDLFPGIVLVSVDPERDTPEILETYLRNFGSDLTGLTGTVEAVRELTRPLGIYFKKSGGLDADYGVDHSSVVLLVDDRTNWRAVFSAPHDVDSFVHDVSLLMEAG